jgi:hypothetical protein
MILFLTGGTLVHAQGSDWVRFRGYLKELGAVSVSNDLETWRYDNIVHHRLESAWHLGDGFRLQADLRTRWISGYSAKNIPAYGAILEADPGLVDLSTNWIDRDGHILNSSIDRLHLSWEHERWEAHVGRQRINWGKTMVWNPNDLFNTYSWLDFDYEERPGTDAIRLAYNWGVASSVEAGYKAATNPSETVFAAMYRGSLGTYDVQAIAGHYQGDWVLGGGWSGYVQTSGFKAEASVFLPDGSLSASLGADHMMDNGTYLVGEILYNGGYSDQPGNEAALFQVPSADNLFISKTAYFAQAYGSPHPLVNVSLGLMGSFTDSIVLVIPQASVSVRENLDFLVLAQILRGRELKSLSPTPNGIYLRLKWSY